MQFTTRLQIQATGMDSLRISFATGGIDLFVAMPHTKLTLLTEIITESGEYVAAHSQLIAII